MPGPAEIREATEGDVPQLLELIRGLARYEKLEDEVAATAEQLAATLFGSRRYAEALLACNNEQAVGFALFFHNYSTFLSRPGLYLEDLFVVPEWRGRGIGTQLLARVAQIAVRRDCGRLEWSVLDWNEPAMAFYASIGARSMKEWIINRMTGDELHALAGRA